MPERILYHGALAVGTPWCLRTTLFTRHDDSRGVNATTVYERMLGSSTDAFLRRMAINFAIVGFLLHLLCCVLYDFKLIESDDLKSLFDSYLDAFVHTVLDHSCIRSYELIRAIPESFSNSIGKQLKLYTSCCS